MFCSDFLFRMDKVIQKDLDTAMHQLTVLTVSPISPCASAFSHLNSCIQNKTQLQAVTLTIHTYNGTSTQAPVGSQKFLILNFTRIFKTPE